ncbi:MAG: hypothetical protein PHI71_01920 [Acidiphilium sp.]|nr:hypothetical protein [Acidiphilium sp.]
MPSSLYTSLQSRLNYLVTGLPAAPTPGSSLTVSQKDGIAFYAVMTHAACEHYLEHRCAEIADYALNLFQTRKKINRVGKHLCLLPYVTFTNNDKDFKVVAEILGATGFGIYISKSLQTSNNGDLAAAIDRGHKAYKKTISGNHGISFKYQFKLLSYIGFDIKTFSPNFVSRVQQLADLRGEAAHKEVVAVQTLPSITDLSVWTQDLLGGYLLLDTALKRLKSVAA